MGKQRKYAKDLKPWSLEMPDKLKDYTSHFNVEDFGIKLLKLARNLSQHDIYGTSLLLCRNGDV